MRYSVIALALIALGARAASAANEKAPTLDQALKQHAPEIIKYLRDHKVQHVGVLKFLVKQGETTSDNVGPLNLNLAHRLEVALVLANPDEQLMIIQRASNAIVEAKNKRATHLTPEGRAALFQIRDKFIPAWGDGEPVRADAFLTGVVEFDRNLRQMTVIVQAFDRKSEDLAKVCSFTASTDFRTLADTGRAFRLGARGPDESELLAQAIDLSVKENEKKEPHPLESGKSPIDLKVLYNNEVVPLRNGMVREPHKNEKVQFVLINRDPKERYAVVLKVNGENTLFRETYEPLSCTKWVLGPGEEVTIRGFQKQGSPLVKDKAEGFEVLSPEQSEKDAVYYGEHAGTFSVVVFRENRSNTDRIKTATYDMAAISRGTLSPNGKRPGTLAALKGLLHARAEKAKDDNQRGIVVGGEEVNQPVEYRTFKTDPVPEVVATIRYWLPPR